MTSNNSYAGISAREARLAELLEEVRRTYTMRLGQGSLSSRICEALDAKCGIHVHSEAETLSRGGVRQGRTFPCVLPAGHYGQCVGDEVG